MRSSQTLLNFKYRQFPSFPQKAKKSFQFMPKKTSNKNKNQGFVNQRVYEKYTFKNLTFLWLIIICWFHSLSNKPYFVCLNSSLSSFNGSEMTVNTLFNFYITPNFIICKISREDFNSTWSYIDGVLSPDNPTFGDYVNAIYPRELRQTFLHPLL